MKHKTLLFHLFPQIHHCPIRYRAIDQYFHFSSLFFVPSLFQRTTKRTSGRGPLYIELTQMSERTEASDFRKRDRTRRSSRGKTRFHSIVLEGTAARHSRSNAFRTLHVTRRGNNFSFSVESGERLSEITIAHGKMFGFIYQISNVEFIVEFLKENLFYFLQYTLSVF